MPFRTLNSAYLILVGLTLLLLVVPPVVLGQVQELEDSGNQTVDHGIQLYNQGQDHEAIKVLKTVVKRHPNEPDGWYYLGLALYRQGLIAQASSRFERVIRLHADLPDSYAKLSFAYILANEPEKAMAAAKQAIELGDKSAEPHYAIAEASYRGGAWALAAAEADIALSANPQFYHALITRSLALWHLKQYSEAAASLARYIAMQPSDADVDVWREQMEMMLRSSEPPPNKTNKLSAPTIFSGTNVNTKARVTVKPEPGYTDSARLAGVTGKVVIRCIFSADRRVTSITIIQALPYGLTSKAVAAARKMEFDPAVKDGRSVSMYMQLEYIFNLY
jgi:TonB family protein